MFKIRIRLAFIYSGFFLIFITPLASQTKEFYTSKWEKVDSSDKADFYRIIQKLDSRFKISDYYITNEIQFEGFALNTINPLIFDDTIKYFYKKRGLQIQSVYNKGKRQGFTYSFYPNGKVKSRYYFTQDTLNGEFSSYYPWGEIRTKGLYKNNQQVGRYLSYFFHGGVELDQEIFDPLNSNLKEYDLLGNLKVNSKIRNGQMLYDTIPKQESKIKFGPKSDTNFFIANNCRNIDSGIIGLHVFVCSKKFNNFTFHLLHSKRMNNLKNFMQSRHLKDNEIYFLFSPEKDYLSWRMSASLKDAFRSAVLSYFSMIEILENHYYHSLNFSKSNAVDVLFREIQSDSESMNR